MVRRAIGADPLAEEEALVFLAAPRTASLCEKHHCFFAEYSHNGNVIVACVASLELRNLKVELQTEFFWDAPTI